MTNFSNDEWGALGLEIIFTLALGLSKDSKVLGKDRQFFQA